MGRLSEAEDALERARDAASEIDDAALPVMAKTVLANIRYILGDYWWAQIKWLKRPWLKLPVYWKQNNGSLP